MVRDKETIKTIEIDSETLHGLDYEKIIKCDRCNVYHDIYNSYSFYNDDNEESVCEHCMTEEDYNNYEQE